jgi:maltose/maltodextrin transport system permease protein
MWLLKGYFDTNPNSLEEAAMIDGSTRFQTFWKIILPLAAPMLSVVFLIVFMANFNEYLLASVVLQSPEKYTFAVGLRSFAYSSEYQMEWGLFTAASLLGAIPMVILSLSLQKYLVSGLTSGSVKG